MNTKLIIHIVISLISLSGLIVYYYAFLLGYKKHNSQLKKQSKLPEKLYFMSTYPALIWYVLPFIEQPRMHGIYDWLNGEFVFFNVLYIPVSFLLFVYFFGIWGKKSVSQNIEATKSAFYAPSKLLTEGIYASNDHRGYIRTFFFGVINRWNLHLHFIPYICIYRSLYDKNTG